MSLDPVICNLLTEDEILNMWGNLFGPNSFLCRLKMYDPFRGKWDDEKIFQNFKVDLKNQFHRGMVSIVAGIKAERVRLREKYSGVWLQEVVPRVVLNVEGGKWTAGGWGQHYEMKLTMGSGHHAPVWEICITIL